MKIIIVGCGKVGATLVEKLSGENNDIVVIDELAKPISDITDEYDALGIVGNGVSFEVLREAGVKDADLLLAVTDSDEQNLLCCLIAKKAGKCQTIARVRNPIYHSEVNFLTKEFGLAQIINPEQLAADEIARLLQFPAAIKIDKFARGHVEMHHFKVMPESKLIGEKVSHVRTNFNSNILVATVSRDDEVIIPNGEFVFQEGDKVTIIGQRLDAISFFKKIGILKDRVQKTMIAGGGKISYYLTKSLLRAGIKVTVIEQSRERCDFLSEELPEATIICGDATDQKLLAQEGLEDMQGLVSLTGLDEENIFLSLYAKEVNDRLKTVTKVNRISFKSVIDDLNLDSVINPRMIMADNITRYVRSMSNSRESNVESLYKLEDGKAEALEFTIKEDSQITGVPLMDLPIRKNTLIASIYRNTGVIVPSGQDVLKKNDSVIVIISGYRISDIKEVLEDR